jgi:hypothetical protein
MRICSLLPSATEIVAELGLVGSLVGIPRSATGQLKFAASRS